MNRLILKIPAFLALVVAGLLAAPALATAAQSFAISSPTGYPAGGDPTYTTTTVLDASAGNPGAVTITLAPGVLASLAANPSCLKGAANYTSACQIGQGSAATSVPGVSLSLTAYLVPPPNPSTDAAGIDLQTSAPGVPPTHIAVALIQTASGNVASRLSFSLASLGPLAGQLTKLTLTVNGTLGGKPFTRMPSNCTPGHSSLTVQYANATETTQASPDFAPTGCSALPFAPQLTGSAVKDPHDGGVEVVTSQTQAPGEAAGASTALVLPWPALSSNLSSLSLQNTTKAIGTAVVTSPLQATPLAGNAYLTGTPFGPTLTLRFPPPVALTLVGNVNLTAHSVTFLSLPDVPQTALVVTLFGGPQAAESATCAPPGGTLRGTFVAQNGKTSTASEPLTVTGCPTAPTLSAASLTGLAKRRPVLRFKLARGSDAPNLRSVTISLPRGLAFDARHLGKGISISARHTLKLRGGKLVVTLAPAARSLAVRISAPALRAHKAPARRAVVRISVADAAGAVASFTVSG